MFSQEVLSGLGVVGLWAVLIGVCGFIVWANDFVKKDRER